MEPNLFNVKTHYAKDENLKKQEVAELIEWTKKYHNLPDINEIQAILFLQKWNYKKELAKAAITTYFSYKKQCSDVFLGKNPFSSPFKQNLEVSLFTILPTKTPDGHNILFGKALDPTSDKYDMVSIVKYVYMVTTLHLYQEGSTNGFLFVVDMWDFPHDFVKIIEPEVLKKFFYYLIEIIPWEFKGLHYINPPPFMNEVLNLVEPAMQKELGDLLYVYENLDEFTKKVPKECLPHEYGGALETSAILHEKVKNKLFRHAEFFEWDDQQEVREVKNVEEKSSGVDSQSVKIENPVAN